MMRRTNVFALRRLRSILVFCVRPLLQPSLTMSPMPASSIYLTVALHILTNVFASSTNHGTHARPHRVLQPTTTPVTFQISYSELAIHFLLGLGGPYRYAPPPPGSAGGRAYPHLFILLRTVAKLDCCITSHIGAPQDYPGTPPLP